MKKLLTMSSRALHLAEDILVYIGSLLIFAMMMITVVEIIGRTWFNNPIPGSEEIPSLFLILIATIGLAAVQRENRHVGINMIQEKLKGRAAAAFEVFLLSFLLFVCIVIACFGWLHVVEAKARQLTTMGPLFLPTWPFKLVLPFGFGLMAIRVTVQIKRFVQQIIGKG